MNRHPFNAHPYGHATPPVYHPSPRDEFDPGGALCALWIVMGTAAAILGPVFF